MQCNCLAYDIYSSWRGGDQNRPYSVSAETKRSRMNNAQLQQKYRRDAGPLCSCTCIAALLLAERQQHEGRAPSASTLLSPRSNSCNVSTAGHICSGAAWDSTHRHQPLPFTHLQHGPESTIRSHAQDSMPVTLSPPVPMGCLRHAASDMGWPHCLQCQPESSAYHRGTKAFGSHDSSPVHSPVPRAPPPMAHTPPVLLRAHCMGICSCIHAG